MPRRIFLDTEWTAPPWEAGCELMWVGLADEAGRSWYGISAEVVIAPADNPFVAGVFRLVDPDEPRLTRAQLAAAVLDFCGAVDEFWVHADWNRELFSRIGGAESSGRLA